MLYDALNLVKHILTRGPEKRNTVNNQKCTLKSTIPIQYTYYYYSITLTSKRVYNETF